MGNRGNELVFHRLGFRKSRCHIIDRLAQIPDFILRNRRDSLGEIPLCKFFRNRIDAETMQKGMHVIVNETERLSRMVEELLDFSRMQSGRLTVQPEPMDILAELGDAVLIYMEKAKREHIRMIYQEPEMLPFVYGDKNRIRQVFINVIDNALKYSNPGGLVTVSAEAIAEQIQVRISDNGVGISAADLPKVKTKFFKANHTRRGSGIGLAVANEIITMHHGKLDIQSELGKGTTVIITLPAMSDHLL